MVPAADAGVVLGWVLLLIPSKGWNIGKPCYGYLADKIPHPVPAKRAEGKTKTRLLPDPVRGPVVTRIFHHRVLGRLG